MCIRDRIRAAAVAIVAGAGIDGLQDGRVETAAKVPVGDAVLTRWGRGCAPEALSRAAGSDSNTGGRVAASDHVRKCEQGNMVVRGGNAFQQTLNSVQRALLLCQVVAVAVVVVHRKRRVDDQRDVVGHGPGMGCRRGRAHSNGWFTDNAGEKRRYQGCLGD